MLSVAIVGLLAAIAIPSFQLYRFRTRTAESGAIASSIKVSQESYAAVTDAYANITLPNPNPAGPAGPPTVSKRAWDTLPCPGTCSRTAPANCTTFACIGFAPAGPVHYHYTSPSLAVGAGTPNEYSIGAAGDVDADGALGSYSFQTANTGGGIGFVLDGVSTCPLMPAGQLHNCRPTTF